MYTVFSKNDCDYCKKAVAKLKAKGLPCLEIKLGSDIPSRDVFIDLIKSLAPVDAVVKSVPQIFKSGEYIGGFDDLVLSMQEGVNEPSL
jgi:glutaredoxin